MDIDWSSEKNDWLEKSRGVSFEILAEKILRNEILDDIAHPNKEKYPGQFMFIIEIEAYCYAVPYVETETGVFLKTVFPTRKMTKKYLGTKNENDR